MSTTMTPAAKAQLSKTIRGLRERLLTDLGDALYQTYKLGLKAKKARLSAEAAARRERIEDLTQEKLRALKGQSDAQKKAIEKDAAPFIARIRGDLVKEAAYTLLNRLVYLRLLEAAGLREVAVLTGGWRSPGYADFRELAPDLVRDKTEGYALLLRVVFDELALDLPQLYGRGRLIDLELVPPETLRHVVEALDDDALESCWTDDMTLGWVYQYWNDPEREALDAKLNDGGKVERHEIASKTQMFTERYMVDWLLQNSLGPMWLAMCKKRGWTPHCEAHGTLARLEERRVAWRAKRDAGEVELTELMPLDSDEERRWAYYVPQPIPEDAVKHAPASVRKLKILDPAVGSGHFLVVAFDLLVALYREEAAHRGDKWSDVEIVESILENNLHGIDLDPRAVQIAAAALWLKAQQVAQDARPKTLNLVASQLHLAGLADDDPALVELREAIARETSIPAELTNEVIHALKGADHLGSLLKVGDVLKNAVKKAQKQRGDGAQGSLLEGFTSEQLAMPTQAIDPEQAKQRLHSEIESFLALHTSSADLGLRLRGEQLASGIRFLRMVRESTYDLVVGNPPYQGTSKMVDAKYIAKHYRRGKADLYAAFLQRGLELVHKGGTSALLTMRNWMFIKQFSDLRKWLLENRDLRVLLDLSSGAFGEISAAQIVVSVASTIFRRAPSAGTTAIAQKAFDEASLTTPGETARKRAAVLCHVGRYEFEPGALKVIPEWPFIYWWDQHFLSEYGSATKLNSLCAITSGAQTSPQARYLRFAWEPSPSRIFLSRRENGRSIPSPEDVFVPFIGGGEGAEWYHPLKEVALWRSGGLELKCMHEWKTGTVSKRVAGEQWYFTPGISAAAIGTTFSARVHTHASLIGHMGSSLFPVNPDAIVCTLNSTKSREILAALNPGYHFEVGDLARLPYTNIEASTTTAHTLAKAYDKHEHHREPSTSYQAPGPTPWHQAQEWAQRAIDRPPGTPLPQYEEQLDPEPNTDHISYALGVALGRFGAEGMTERRGILDPERDDLSHALPDGILFLDGTLDPDSALDSLGHPACSLLRDKWKSHPPEGNKRGSLRDYLRLDFFSDIHRQMYESRPIHWPLSSQKKTFVAWVTIHRFTGQTLRRLLAEHLHPTKLRLVGKLDDLRAARSGADKKAARAADKALPKLEKIHGELVEFIADVSTCAERGPASVNPKKHPKTDAPYDPVLDDGVMINSAALWPLLQPQWKDPKKWWKELCTAKGRKDYDWSQLAARYFPERVEEKCTEDPSLAVAHGCFWRYHPERAYAWELRLQDEIEENFTIDEDWSAKLDEGADDPKNSDEARAAFLKAKPNEAKELRAKENKRRDRKRKKEQRELA